MAMIAAMALWLAGCSMAEEVRQRCAGAADQDACVAEETAKQTERQRALEQYHRDERRYSPTF